MKIEGYEEISVEEHDKLGDNEGLEVNDWETDKVHHFKKAQKFPMNFTIDPAININVYDDGQMNFNRDRFLIFTIFPGEIPKLVKAVEKAKEVMKKNETD